MMLSGQRTIWTKQCEDNQEISVRLAQWSVFTVFTIYSVVVHVHVQVEAQVQSLQSLQSTNNVVVHGQC